ncbi:MAG TPA: tetratricopeptide repeat protein [Planctomycetota bacterium]|nr:tetratricopeptide repeat protein [Planctomycetota bacterium]
MRRWTVVLMAAMCAAAPRAVSGQGLLHPPGAGPDVDDLRRRTVRAEDLRFRRTVDLARQLSAAGRLEEARRLYEEAHLLRADDDEVTESLLDVLRSLGDPRAQLEIYRAMLPRTGLVTVRFRMGECLWRLGRTDEARETMNDLLRRFPTERSAWLMVVDFYLAEKQWTDARDVLDRCRRRFGDDVTLHLRRARLPGDAEGTVATDELLAALRLDPSEDDRERAERMLFDLAQRTGRTDALVKTLRDELAAVDARLTARLIELADEAAKKDDFAGAVAFAEEALPFLTDPVRRAALAAKLAAWRTRVPNPPR